MGRYTIPKEEKYFDMEDCDWRGYPKEKVRVVEVEVSEKEYHDLIIDLKERKIGLNREVDTDTVQTEFRCYADMDSIILGIDCLGEEEGAREDCCQNFFHKFVSYYISDANLAKKR